MQIYINSTLNTHTHSKLPSYFQNIDYYPERLMHHYNTKTQDFVYLVKHEFAKKSLEYIIPKLICIKHTNYH